MEEVKQEKKNTLKQFLDEHQTVASVLSIIVSMIVIMNWMVSDIREGIKETNKRIDALFQYVLVAKDKN